MKLWRTFVRWIARKEISELAETYIAAMAEHTAFAERAAAGMQQQADLTNQLVQQTELCRRMAYAEGQMAGRQEMYDRINDIVCARTNGAGDYVSEEDLKRAKRGLIH